MFINQQSNASFACLMNGIKLPNESLLLNVTVYTLINFAALNNETQRNVKISLFFK